MNPKPEIVVALAGNPNSGKTSLFNLLAGEYQKVGNWAGVTVEKYEGSVDYKGLPAILLSTKNRMSLLMWLMAPIWNVIYI